MSTPTLHYTQNVIQLEQTLKNGQHIKSCSSFLAIREIQIKSTMRFHYHLPKILKLKKKLTPPNVGKNVGQTELFCYWSCETVVLWRKKAWQFLIKLLYGPTTPLPDVYTGI